MFTAKRLSLQLTPLLDLLLIVIFAQYMEMEQQTQAVTEQRTDELAALQFELSQMQQKLSFTESVLSESQKMRFQTEADLASTQSARDQEREQAESDRSEMVKRLEQMQQQRDRIVAALKKAFAASSEELAKILEALTVSATTPQPIDPQEIEQLASQLEQMQPGELATFLLAYEEIRKRCDLWEIHINAQEMIVVSIGEEHYELRANTEQEFQDKLFNLYKSLPQTKGLVIMMVSYGEVRAAVRQTVLTSLPELSARMRDDADGRTRFEYAVIGYLPEE